MASTQIDQHGDIFANDTGGTDRNTSLFNLPPSNLGTNATGAINPASQNTSTTSGQLTQVQLSEISANRWRERRDKFIIFVLSVALIALFGWLYELHGETAANTQAIKDANNEIERIWTRIK